MGRSRARADLLDELGQLLPRARRLIWRLAEARLQRLGDSMFEWPLLRRLMTLGPMSQCRLATLAAQHPAAVSRTLDELERRGLVRRRRDAEDRRRMVVAITARGAARCRAAHREVLVVLEEAFRPLKAPEREQLRDLLRRLVGSGDEQVSE